MKSYLLFNRLPPEVLLADQLAENPYHPYQIQHVDKYALKSRYATFYMSILGCFACGSVIAIWIVLGLFNSVYLSSVSELTWRRAHFWFIYVVNSPSFSFPSSYSQLPSLVFSTTLMSKNTICIRERTCTASRTTTMSKSLGITTTSTYGSAVMFGQVN